VNVDSANARDEAGTDVRVIEPGLIVPGGFTAWFYRGFGRYVARLFKKRFHAVRIAPGGMELLRGLDGVDTPVMVLLNHSSWWDPLLCVLLGSKLVSSRSGFGPMDAKMLKKFGLFKKLGLFGVDPDEPRALKPMVAYCIERFERDAKATLWATPQGAFADVRDPIVLRPGMAAVAARASAKGIAVRVVCVSVEYAFWLEQKAEVFVRVVEVTPRVDEGADVGRATTARWHRALTEAMNANAAELARLVRGRDSGAFEVLVGGGGSGTNPVYDLWRRVTGRGGGIQTRPTKSRG
jgi:1-acyl-sn-glycerol-3-phosphate acyltransferase